MATLINHPISGTYTPATSRDSVFTRFFAWTRAQQSNRLLWVGLALAGHGCIVTPLTVMAVLLAGTNLTLFILAIIAMGAALVTNLAALPTRITIPVFLASILVDLGIIIACIAIGFDITTTYI